MFGREGRIKEYKEGLDAQNIFIVEFLDRLPCSFPWGHLWNKQESTLLIVSSWCTKQLSLAKDWMAGLYPTSPFTILELQNPLHDVPNLHKTRRSADFEDLKLWKVSSGNYYNKQSKRATRPNISHLKHVFHLHKIHSSTDFKSLKLFYVWSGKQLAIATKSKLFFPLFISSNESGCC